MSLSYQRTPVFTDSSSNSGHSLAKQAQNASSMQLDTISQLYRSEQQSAQAARLQYIADTIPGFTRVRRGKGFSYRDPEGLTVKDTKVRKWIESLVIPPAWQEVWISPEPDAHLLVTGRDDKGRKQYIYHPRWRKIRDLLNFYRLILFGEHLPKIRRKIQADLQQPSLSHTKVLAIVLSVLDRSYIRIGNEEYVKQNDSFGLTTLRDEHVQFDEEQITFHFRGKSGKDQEVSIKDPELAELVESCKRVPGSPLFSYYTETGTASISANEVNEYLKEITKENFTAKSFRTWGGTLTTYRTLRDELRSEPDKTPKKMLSDALDATAEKLGNTRAVSKAHYVHPHIISAFEEGRLPQYLEKIPRQKAQPYMTRGEKELVYLLRLLLESELQELSVSS